MLLDAMPRLAKHAYAVGLVEHEPGVVTPAQIVRRRQIENVAIHRENCVRDHQFASAFRGAAQLPFKIVHIVMTEAGEFAAGQQTAIDNTGMVPPVGKDPVPPADYRAYSGKIGHIAGTVDDGLFAPCEIGNCPFHLGMKIQCAPQNSDTMCTGSILIRGCFGRGHYAWMVDQSQVAVGCKHQFALASSMYPRPLQSIYRLKIVVVFAGFRLFCAFPPGIDSLRKWIDLFTTAVQEGLERRGFDGCCGDAIGMNPNRLCSISALTD